MKGTKVAIRRVALDPPFTKHPTLQRYRITLECGCLWWEDYAELERLPRVGQLVDTDMRPMHGHVASGDPSPATLVVSSASATDTNRTPSD